MSEGNRRAGGAVSVAERGRPVIGYRRDSARLTTDECNMHGSFLLTTRKQIKYKQYTAYR